MSWQPKHHIPFILFIGFAQLSFFCYNCSSPVDVCIGITHSKNKTKTGTQPSALIPPGNSICILLNKYQVLLLRGRLVNLISHMERLSSRKFDLIQLRAAEPGSERSNIQSLSLCQMPPLGPGTLRSHWDHQGWGPLLLEWSKVTFTWFQLTLTRAQGSPLFSFAVLHPSVPRLSPPATLHRHQVHLAFSCS